MRVAILTFDGFNEIDSFVALGLLNRLAAHGWKAEIAAPTAEVTSMNGVVVRAQQPLEFGNEADVVLFGSGLYTRAIAEDGQLLDRLTLDPVRQLIGGQCSGVLLMSRLGLLADRPASTDTTTRPWLVEAGVRVEDTPFQARGPIATAGGCMASVYLAAWVMLVKAGEAATREALTYVAPVGEKESWVERVLGVVGPAMTSPAAGG